MDHLQILLMTAHLALGAGISVYAGLTAKKYGDAFLRPLATYTALFNLLFLGLLVAFYTQVNQPELFSFLRLPAARETSRLLVTALEFGLVLILWRIGLGLRDKPMSSRAQKAVFLAAAVLALSYALKLSLPGPSPFVRALTIGQSFLFDNLILLEIPVLAVLFFRMKKHPHPAGRKLGRTFAGLYLCRYAVALLALGFVFSVSDAPLPRFFVRTALLAVCNVIPLLWLKAIFLPARVELSSRLAEIPARLGEYYEERRITAREQEIIKFLLAGKRNKEISAALFIAESTVKNHVHSILEKLGVKTRAQLISTLLENDPGRTRTPAGS